MIAEMRIRLQARREENKSDCSQLPLTHLPLIPVNFTTAPLEQTVNLNVHRVSVWHTVPLFVSTDDPELWGHCDTGMFVGCNIR